MPQFISNSGWFDETDKYSKNSFIKQERLNFQQKFFVKISKGFIHVHSKYFNIYYLRNKYK